LPLTLIMALSAFAAYSVIPACSAVLDPRSIQSETLNNGLRLIVAPDSETQVVSAEIIVKVGSADEVPGQRGIAHLLEHVLWTSLDQYGNDPRARVESVGGVINAGTLRDYTRFYATVPASHANLALEAVSSFVLQAHVDQTIIDREIRIIAEESATRSEDPRAVLNDLAFREVYGQSHPYSSPIQGSPQDLAAIDASRLMLFRQTWYSPNNMAVIVAGRTTFDEARAECVRLLGHLSPTPVPPRHRPEATPPADRERIFDLPYDQAYVMAAFLGPSASEHGRVCASDLLATILAHDLIGRLTIELQENRRIASAVGVDFLTQQDRSLFGVWSLCEPDCIFEVQEAIRAELKKIAQQPMPPGELAAAKQLLAAGYIFANETPADRAATLGFYEAIDTYRAASYYLSWVKYSHSTAVTDIAASYSGDPIWIILCPEIEP